MTDAKTYKRTNIYATKEQLDWFDEFVGQAKINHLPLSASDLVRFALDHIKTTFPNYDELNAAVVKHVQQEAVEYPGRSKRGLPPAPHEPGKGSRGAGDAGARL